MTDILSDHVTSAQHKRLDGLRPRMAKVLNTIETPWREQVGRAVARTFALAGVSQKEAAALLDRDPAQVARWISGVERPAIDVILSVARLRGPFVIGLAELGGEAVDIETTIRIKRIA